MGRLQREGRIDHHSPLVSDVAIGRGSAWLWMPMLTGSSWDDEPGILRRVDLATGKVIAGVELLAAAMEPCAFAAPGVGLEPTTYGLTVRRSAN